MKKTRVLASAVGTKGGGGATKTVSTPKANPTKRRQGRPASGGNDVGREHLLAVTERLLRTMPPARVTILRVAREANADPGLIRYYFGNRAALLVAVVDRVTAHAQNVEQRTQYKDPPAIALAGNIALTVQLVRRAPFLHRLILEELNDAGTEESRARVAAMNLDMVQFYRELLIADGGRELVEADPLFLYCVILGASDFFASAESLIRDLFPAETDMEKVSASYQQFMVKLILDGLRKR